jgi:hypothetical protein
MFCCGVAFAAMLFSIYAWLPLPPLPVVVMFSLLAAGAAAAFVAGAALVRHHLVFWALRVQPQIKVTLPRGYWVAAVAALGYFLAVFFGIYLAYPPSATVGPPANLRIASATALLFGAFALGLSQWAGLRVRALRSAP